MSPGELAETRALIDPEAFYDLRNRGVWRALCTLADSRQPIVADTVAALLRDAKDPDPFTLLSALIEHPPEAPSAAFHRDRVLDAWKRRIAYRTATQLAEAARDPGRQIDLELTAASEACNWQVGRGTLPRFDDIAALADETLPTPPALIGGLLRRGEKAVLGGASKSFKSWLCLDLALCVSHGITWLGRDVAPGLVLLVNLELPRWCIRKRLIDVATARGVRIEASRLLVWTLRGYKVTAQQLRAEIARANLPGLALVVIDPAYKLLQGRDENSASDIANLLSHFEGITADSGASILVPTHFAKGNPSLKESQDRISGSGVFARDPDSILTLTRHEEDKAFTVEATLRTFAPVAPFVIRWEHPVFSVDGTLDPEKLKRAKTGPSVKYTPERLLKLLPAGGLPRPAWCKRCTSKLGVSKTTFYSVASECEEAGLIDVGDGDLCSPAGAKGGLPYAD